MTNTDGSIESIDDKEGSCEYQEGRGTDIHRVLKGKICNHVIKNPISADPSLAERHVGHLTIIIRVWHTQTERRPALPKDRLPIRHGSLASPGTKSSGACFG